MVYRSSIQLRYYPYVTHFDMYLMKEAKDDEVDQMAMWDIESDECGIMP